MASIPNSERGRVLCHYLYTFLDRPNYYQHAIKVGPTRMQGPLWLLLCHLRSTCAGEIPLSRLLFPMGQFHSIAGRTHVHVKHDNRLGKALLDYKLKLQASSSDFSDWRLHYPPRNTTPSAGAHCRRFGRP